MALVKKETIQGFQGLPVLRQLGLMIGLAASVALGVSIVLWSQTPNYTILVPNIDGKSGLKIIESLKKANIKHKMDEEKGNLLVESSQLHKARLHLSGANLPSGGRQGFEIYNKPGSPLETDARRRQRGLRALEVELARTITSFEIIKSARVHITTAPVSQFVWRKNSKAKASVAVDTYGGKSLQHSHVKAIVNLVAYAVDGLEPQHVTVVDRSRSDLLTRKSANSEMALTEGQYDYKARVENELASKIEDMITPIVGIGRVRARVEVKLNPVRTEQARKTHNPDNQAKIQEEITETRNGGAATAQGQVGAVANQPAKPGTTKKDQAAAKNESAVGSSTKVVRKSYKTDEVISSIKIPAGEIQKISIALLVDNKREPNKKGELVIVKRSKEEMQQIVDLAKGAVGFNALRGDVLKVTNSAFHTPPPVEPLPPVPLLEQPWLWDLVKQVVGGIAVLILMFAVLKPVLKSLAEKGEEMQAIKIKEEAAAESEQQQAQLSQDGAAAQLPSPEQKFEEQLNTARSIVGDDPGRVAQVVRNWVANDG